MFKHRDIVGSDSKDEASAELPWGRLGKKKRKTTLKKNWVRNSGVGDSNGISSNKNF